MCSHPRARFVSSRSTSRRRDGFRLDRSSCNREGRTPCVENGH
jgi:hypothetical protein